MPCGLGAFGLVASQPSTAADFGTVSTPLHTAAKAGDAATAQRLLSSGAAVDARDEWHRTPLHVAAACGHTAVVKLLLSAGAAVDVVRTGGWTALQLAAASGKAHIVQLLLAAGARVSAQQPEGPDSAIAAAAEYAARTGDATAVNVFMQHHAIVAAPQGLLWAAALAAASERSSYPGIQKDVVSRLLLSSVQQAANTFSVQTTMRNLLCQLHQHIRPCLQLVTGVLFEAWLQEQHGAAATGQRTQHGQQCVQDMLVSGVTGMQ